MNIKAFNINNVDRFLFQRLLFILSLVGNKELCPCFEVAPVYAVKKVDDKPFVLVLGFIRFRSGRFRRLFSGLFRRLFRGPRSDL